MRPSSIQKSKQGTSYMTVQETLKKKGSQARLKEELTNRLYDKGIGSGKLPGIPRSKSQRFIPSAVKLPMNRGRKRSKDSSQRLNQASILASGSALNSYREMTPDREVTNSQPPAQRQSHSRGKSFYNLYKAMDYTSSQTAREESKKYDVHLQGVSTVVKSVTGYTVYIFLFNLKIDNECS